MTERFETNVASFASSIETLLEQVFGQVPACEVTFTGQRAVIDFERLPLKVAGRELLALDVDFGCRPDATGNHLAVTKSKFTLWPVRKRTPPLFRLDYQDDMVSAPSAHWQVYAERGDLVLALANRRVGATELGALHIPVGGARFRPCLEDVLQFAIDDLGVDALGGARRVLDVSRYEWRVRQLKTTVRDAPREASEALRDLGYTVTPPSSGDPTTRAETFTKW